MSAEFVSIRNGHYRENWVATLTVRTWPVAGIDAIGLSDR